ncbi:MAG TPA: ABC transporter permease [Bryobacteraceae bacterium]|jgi:predicted permease|nr:ABC transporter permease [Bryobacteraceae bacterium]
MSIGRNLVRGFRNLVRRKHADGDIADEVDSFIAEAKADFEARGFTAEAAARATRMALGSSTALREEVRFYGWENMIDGMFQDLRYALRRLRATPAFTLVSIGTLALGLGATSAIFSVINGVLLKPLPYAHPEQLVAVWMTAPGVKIADLNMAPSVYFTMCDEERAFQAVSIFATGSTTVTGKTHPEEVRAVFATHELLPILGVQPQLGRFFAAADDDPKGVRTAMLSDGYWRSHFGGDRSVLGRQLLIEGNTVSIIGVLPPSFQFMDHKADLLIPMRFDRAKTNLGVFSYQGVGRLKPGVTLKQADADLARMLPLVAQRFPPPAGYTVKMFDDARIAPNLRLLKDDLVGDIGNMLWVVMATVGIVLLIACANVANLLLVRTEARQQELAVRAALGAGAVRIARELLFESVTLGAIAGAVGLGLSRAGLKLLTAPDLVHLPRSGDIRIDGWVLLFTLIVSIGFSLLFGLIPVLRHVRPRLANTLRSGGRSMSHSKDRQQVRSFLVIFQVALALVLLVTSGLMIRTFRNLHHVDPGFTNAQEIQTVRIGIPDEDVKEPERVIHMQQAMLEKVRAVNGVISASVISSVPMGGGESNDPVYAADKTYREGTIAPLRRYKSIAPAYFTTMGQRLLAGRDLTWADIYNGGEVAVVSENTARDIWGAPEAALGKRIRPNQKDNWREVIGVVADERADGVDKPAPTIVYWPLLTKNFESEPLVVERYISFVIRTPRAGSVSLENEIQKALWSVYSNLPLAKTDTLQTFYSRSLARTSFTLLLLAIAGGMALLLGLVGIYGVISYSVSQRTREIGIRLALGAPIAQVTTAFVRSGLILSAIGCGCGLAAALMLVPLMKSLLFSVSPSDPLTYALTSGSLILAAALASYLPARRATKVDPVEALRAE